MAEYLYEYHCLVLELKNTPVLEYLRTCRYFIFEYHKTVLQYSGAPEL
jgi:hypothetical protein